MSHEKIPQPETQDYQEALELVEAVKDKTERLGFFDREFLERLRFFLIPDIDWRKEPPTTYELLPDNTTRELPKEMGSRDENILLLLPSYLEKFYNRQHGSDGGRYGRRGRAGLIWFDQNTQRDVFSQEANITHEIAHPWFKHFDQKKIPRNVFRGRTSTLLEDSPLFQSLRSSVNFHRFPFLDLELQELHALLYQREFVRRTSENGREKLDEWDRHIAEVAADLPDVFRRLNEEFSSKIPLKPDLMYKESHTLSYLLARPFEEALPEFKERTVWFENWENR